MDYRLHDPEDTSEFLSVQYFTKGAMNPCLNSMYAFVEEVTTVIQQYHGEAGQELKIMHLAGDEVAPGAWSSSPECKIITENMEDGKSA